VNPARSASLDASPKLARPPLPLSRPAIRDETADEIATMTRAAASSVSVTTCPPS
jgi:hypothetical protein